MNIDLSTDALKAAILELQRREAQQAAEAGAQLHNEKNAPWINGQYSHLKFPVYAHQAYPKMLYSPAYLPACRSYDALTRLYVRKDEQHDHERRLLLAQREKDEATRIVRSASEWEALGRLWRETPDAAIKAQKDLDLELSTAAAESNFDDRNMSEAAKAERAEFDRNAEDHFAEVPRKSVPAHQRKKPEVVGA